MPDDNRLMLLSETAEYLRVSERTILRMIQNKEIPAVKIANQWRFVKSIIDEWLLSKIVLKNSKKIINDIIPVSRLVDKQYFVNDIKPGTKEEILTQLIQPLITNNKLDNHNSFIKKLLSREELSSTAIGKGIAIPHIRNLNENPSEDISLVIGICRNGVNYNSFDNNPTFIFFLLSTKNEILHLRTIAKICKLFMDNNIIKKLLKTDDINKLLKIIINREYELLNNSQKQ